jgi:CubicO group peptidase (beta-lactamase class C family)
MKTNLVRAVAVALLILCPSLIVHAQPRAQSDGPYFPPRGEWQRRTPEQAGLNPTALAAAVEYAQANENRAPRDQAISQAQSFGDSEPHDAIIGPMSERGPMSGLVIYKGNLVAEWGDTARVEMSHSVTKTFLTTVTGLALREGLIRDVNDKARGYMPPFVDLFEAPHNQPITWDHLLRQTSDWQGALWGKPDWADRPEGKPSEWSNRKLHAPGERYKYNDVRVNVLALATLHVWRRPLPEVLREELMNPIGASSTWRWHGYDNAWIELDGARVQSVSGGGHWGGGMFISALDMARFGYLFLRGGQWKGRRIVPEKWIAMARTPGTANPEYGFANWFLNTGRKPLPAAPESSVTFRGNGQNIIYIDVENDLVVVVRWIANGPPLNEFIGRVLASLPRPAPAR